MCTLFCIVSSFFSLLFFFFFFLKIACFLTVSVFGSTSASSSTSMEALKLFSVMCVFTQRHCDTENKSAAQFFVCVAGRMSSCTLKNKKKGGGGGGRMNNESVCLCGEVLKPFSMMCVFTQRHCDTEKKKKSCTFLFVLQQDEQLHILKKRGGGRWREDE